MENKLDSGNTIECWRAEKARLDKNRGYRNRLGCVGEPISDAIDKVLLLAPRDLSDAIEEIFTLAALAARENLLQYVNDARQAGADEAVNDFSCLDFDTRDIDIDPCDTLAEIAERGWDACLRTIGWNVWTVSELDDEDL